MFKDLLSAFRAPDPNPQNDKGGRLALAALLVRIARVDRTYSPVEKDLIVQTLMERYSLPMDEALTLRAEAEELELHAPDTVRFTRVIKDTVAYDDRLSVVRAMWSVVLADNERDDEEDGLMRLVVNLLGVNDRDSGLARQEVQRRLANGT